MFLLPKHFKDPGIKTGKKVKVAYQKTGKKLQAEMVTIVRELSSGLPRMAYGLLPVVRCI